MVPGLVGEPWHTSGEGGGPSSNYGARRLGRAIKLHLKLQRRCNERHQVSKAWSRGGKATDDGQCLMVVRSGLSMGFRACFDASWEG